LTHDYKAKPHLAGAAEAARALPDFRNLGVVLRILLLVNGLAVVAVLLRNADVSLLLASCWTWRCGWNSR
jgi:hypothetical protein